MSLLDILHGGASELTGGGTSPAQMFAGVDRTADTDTDKTDLQRLQDEAQDRFLNGPGSVNSEGGSLSQSAMEDILKYGPQLSQQQFDAIKEFLPQQTQLALDLRRQYEGQNLALDLENAQRFQPEFQDLQQRLRSQDIDAQLGDVSRLTPELESIRRAAEGDEVSAMRDELRGQILNDLQFGQSLSPEQARATEQAARTADISRGIGGGRGSSNRESVQKALEGRRLQRERQQAASQFMGQEAAQRIDPFLAIAGRPATAQSSAAGFMSNLGNQPTSVGQITDPTGTAMGISQYGQQLARQDAATQFDQFNRMAGTNILASEAKVPPPYANYRY